MELEGMGAGPLFPAGAGMGTGVVVVLPGPRSSSQRREGTLDQDKSCLEQK